LCFNFFFHFYSVFLCFMYMPTTVEKCHGWFSINSRIISA
jgi:hypothetical protein